MPVERHVKDLADLEALDGLSLILVSAEDCIRDMVALRQRLPVEEAGPVWIEPDEIEDVMSALHQMLEADAVSGGTPSSSVRRPVEASHVEFLANRLDTAVQAIRQTVKALGRPPRYTALLLPRDAGQRYELLLAGGCLPVASIELFDLL